MKATKKEFDFKGLTATLQKQVDKLMSERMLYVSDLAGDPSDDELNYLATITDLSSQLRTAALLSERSYYFICKIQ